MIHGDAYRGTCFVTGVGWCLPTGMRSALSLGKSISFHRSMQPGSVSRTGSATHRCRLWVGHPVLDRLPVQRDIRELSTLTALLRDGHVHTAARRELLIRLSSLQTGDDQEWTPF